MSSMGSEDKGGRGTSRRPTERIVDAYEANLEARRQFLHARGVGGGQLEAAHQQLHQTALTYWEAMRYLLADESRVEEFWEEIELWTEQEYARAEDGRLQVDENGHPILQEVPVEGLQSLEDWWGQTRIVRREISDAFGHRTVEEERPQRLRPEILLKICRTLDEAGQELEVLADGPESVPRTKIDDELMEEVEEWRKENLE